MKGKLTCKRRGKKQAAREQLLSTEQRNAGSRQKVAVDMHTGSSRQEQAGTGRKGS